ncbi:MAG: DUF1543 domain-containing protein [Weeksellaceae bacterium]|nr:DUF1543 domain-containing protein [Weeksellaceae bacterium]
MKLFYVILGATPKGRNIEQHDVYFGIAEKLKDLVPSMKAFWPEANGEIHIDAYQEVRFVDGFEVSIVEKNLVKSENLLFFINLGGYKSGVFGEKHEQHLMAGKSMADVVKRAEQTEFYKTMGFENAVSHIDDEYAVDIDDIYNVQDILPQEMKDRFSVVLQKPGNEVGQNVMKIGYLKIDTI